MTENPLAKIALFSSLSVEQQDDLAKYLRTREMAEQEPIFWLGDQGTEFFIIQSGRVNLSYTDESGEEMALAQLGPGQFFGELSLLDGGRRTATARAVEKTVLLSLDQKHFHTFLLKNPSATLHIINVLGSRHRKMLDQLRGVANENEVFREQQTTWTRISDAITSFTARVPFVLGHIIFVIFWISFNSRGGTYIFDVYPFNLLGLVCSLEAIFLSIFVLVSQNRQTEKDRVRADLDYQVNRKAHMEVVQLHEKIDRLSAMVQKQSGGDSPSV